MMILFKSILLFGLSILLHLYSYSSSCEEMVFDSYTLEQGLPNNQIQCVYQDSKGWMWFGTSHGLSRYDGYRFTNYLQDIEDSTSIQGQLIRKIFEDKKGNLYIGTENGGLNLFDYEKERFYNILNNSQEYRYRRISVNDIVEDVHGNLWLGTDFNITVIDSQGRISSLKPHLAEGAGRFLGDFVRALSFDKYGILWIGTNNGLFVYDQNTNTVERVDLPISYEQSGEVWEIFIENDSAWIGTYANGLFMVDIKMRGFEHVGLTPTHQRTETVRTISRSDQGDYWIGTRGGLYIYSKKEGVKGFFKHDEHEVNSLINNSILDIFHNSRGDTWLGTRGGLNLIAKSKQVFRSFKALPGDNRYLNSSIVYAIWIDKKGKTWIGTEDGGINILDPETNRYEYLTADITNSNSISQNCIKSFLDDNEGNLWIGTFRGGLEKLNLNSGKITHLKNNPNDPATLSDNRVWDLCLDKGRGIWIATGIGVDLFDLKTNTFSHFPQLSDGDQVNWIKKDTEGSIWLSNLEDLIIYDPESKEIKRFPEQARWFHEDSKHRYWIATLDNGIALYSKIDGALKYYNTNDGLCNNQALTILEDDNNNLWISTSNGLSKFCPEKECFINFSSRDGLRNSQFTYGAAYKADNGELLFGGISGFDIFNPAEIITDDVNIPMVLTDLKIFNKSVHISDSKNAVLTKSISETQKIILNYTQNVFTIEFATLNFVNSNSNLYSYYLEGFDKGWNEPSTDRSATYTNLDPGNYTLKIRRFIPCNPDNKVDLSLNITINPPYWRTLWFRILLLLTVVTLIYFLIHFLINREKIKSELIFERVKARKLHELDMLKLRFFTNISHEIRTPLTLIIGPLEKLIAKQLPPDEIPEHLNLIHRNAKHLYRLINQLLDFRKLESGNLKLNLTQSDIVRFVSDIVQSFDELAKENNITLKFNTLKRSLVAVFDPDKIEKILDNLLSNAFKFTESGGTISVNMSLIFDSEDDLSSDESDNRFIEISVKDTGKGINQKNIERIFKRFFQPGKDYDYQGTGIGLALVKELVKLHKGEIFVASKPGKGTKFTLRIPYESELPKKQSGQIQLTEELDEIQEQPENETNEEVLSKIMLIIDDNPDVRFFIKSHFSSAFEIYEAKNGQEGWEVALETVPDIIISDIMMPDVDGYEFCKRIKKDERTSHIPVLLLTALHSKEHEIKGLSYGADDYITKPFDLSVIQAKVENILSIRESLKNKFSGRMVLEPTNIIISSPDERFLQKAVEVVEKNISDGDLDIKRFAIEVGVSRMQLYRKLHALTDMTVKEFIKSIRLKRATQLLLQKKMNVSEIAFAVGFKDLSHFRKSFKREFGMSATEYINQNALKDEE